MLKKLPIIVLMPIIVYSIFPIMFTAALLEVPEYYLEIIANFYYLVIGVGYILSFIDIYFICKRREYYKIVKLSLLVKLLFIPIVFGLIILGFFTLIVIIGSGIIVTGLTLGALILFLTTIYSSIGMYFYYKENNLKCNKAFMICQCFFSFRYNKFNYVYC